MFLVPRETELTPDLLHKMIVRFNTDVRKELIKYKNYYLGKQAIENKEYLDSNRKCSKTVTNFCRNIASSYAGYIASPGCISYRCGEDMEDIMDVLRWNDHQTEDSDFLLDALIYGTAAELMYIDETGQTRFRKIDPTTCFAVYDDTLSGDLRYFVRIYDTNQWDNSNVYRVDVYSDYSITHYEMHGDNGQLVWIGEEPHYFSQCPANVFNLADEESVFACIMGLQDAYNTILSGQIDDYAAFCDAYMVFNTEQKLNEENINDIKNLKVIALSKDSSVSYLTKDATNAQVENILDRIQEAIYRIAQCPDFSSESFVGGVSSGVAIKYRLTGMETKSAAIAAQLEKALKRRIEIICGIASLKVGEEVWADIEIDFKRNIPEDISSTVNMINSLHGLVSDATLLSQLPFIDDVNAELETLQEQKKNNIQNNMNAIYAGAFESEEPEEEEDEF